MTLFLVWDIDLWTESLSRFRLEVYQYMQYSVMSGTYLLVWDIYYSGALSTVWDTLVSHQYGNIYLSPGYITWSGSYILVWVIYLGLGHIAQSAIFFPVCDMLGSCLEKDIYFGLGHYIYLGLGQMYWSGTFSWSGTYSLV